MFKIILIVFYLFLIACDTGMPKINEKPEKFILQFSYVGAKDALIPNLIFCDSCTDKVELVKPQYYVYYNYGLKYESYSKLKYIIMHQDLTGAKGYNTSIIRILLNNKQTYFLKKKGGIKVFTKLLEVTEYKNNAELKDNLEIYLRALKGCK
jgi:hypothetical protein